MAGSPWLSGGSCRARTSMISSALPASPASAIAITGRRRDGRDSRPRSRTGTIADAIASATPARSRDSDTRPTPAATTSTPPSSTRRDRSQLPVRPRAASAMAAGAPTSALRCIAGASAMRYAVQSSHRCRPMAVSLSSAARVAAASMSTTCSREMAYTSVSVALAQAVAMRPAQSVPATAPQPPPAARPTARATTQALMAPASAVASAERRFIARAAPANGASASVHTRPIATYRGVPGGWGIPRPCAAAMNSPASQKVTPGASVSR